MLAIGDLAFLGDEAFVNVCRPVVIGRETFTTMRSMILTHNVGHSLLEGFENRFAPVVLEDGAQVGVGAVIYAGCRVGAWSIVASSSYVVADVPAGRVAIGVPARAAGEAHRRPPRWGGASSSSPGGSSTTSPTCSRRVATRSRRRRRASAASRSWRRTARRTAPSSCAEHTGDLTPLAGADAEVVVLVLEHEGGEPPAGVAVIDLLDRRLVGDAGLGPVLDAVREICRKRGMRIAPHPWSYPGLVV